MTPQQLTIDQILRIAADPCERKHKGNPQSIKAHKRVLGAKERTYRKILAVIQERRNATSKEIAEALNVQLNCISGRFSELKALNRIRETGEKRRGASVLVEAK